MKIEEAVTHTVNIYGSATETQAQGSSEFHNSEITSVMRSKKKPLLALYSQPITIIRYKTLHHSIRAALCLKKQSPGVSKLHLCLLQILKDIQRN